MRLIFPKYGSENIAFDLINLSNFSKFPLMDGLDILSSENP